ncbi:hypothetical protein [Paractinoplanes rishiriensis]|uniref:hypothetical protein n=1 Tax=Paractinoplanes rishiriensis TaxID=1050105 RepID=UPI001944E16C|nr:hypothetical protein [Actinoplanes rishiriensis]
MPEGRGGDGGGDHGVGVVQEGEVAAGVRADVLEADVFGRGSAVRRRGPVRLVARGLRGGGNDPCPDDGVRGLAMVRNAEWLFSGPGSPTYAMRWWTAGAVTRALQDRMVRRRGHTVFASAAAATLGRWTVPVYEIYKAGEPSHWIEGLDVLRHLDLCVAVVPHYDNKEGGTHDTRFCYLGERRLRVMEQHLPDDAAVLGVDEHTAVHIDPEADSVEVAGRGGLTVRRRGHSTVLPAGTTLTLTDLRGLAHHGAVLRTTVPRQSAVVAAAGPTVTELAADCERRFDEALARGDAPAMTRSILDLEAGVHAWSADTEEDDGAEQARAVLRTLILRQAQVAPDGLRDPTERMRPLVRQLLAAREDLRAQKYFAGADAVRAALATVGVEVHDGPVAAAPQPGPAND